MVKGIIFDMDGVVFDSERLSAVGRLKHGRVHSNQEQPGGNNGRTKRLY